MTDSIEPALSAEEWEASHDTDGEGSVRIGEDLLGYLSRDGNVLYVATHLGNAIGEASSPAKLIALANAALPDTDPRKITRERIKALRRAAEALREEPLGVSEDWKRMDASWQNLAGSERARHEEYAQSLEALADALASYLPPKEM